MRTTQQTDNSLSPDHISQGHVSAARRRPNDTPGTGPRLPAYKGILLVAPPVAALRLDKEFAAMV